MEPFKEFKEKGMRGIHGHEYRLLFYDGFVQKTAEKSMWCLPEAIGQRKVLFMFVLRWERSSRERTDDAGERGSARSRTHQVQSEGNKITLYQRL